LATTVSAKAENQALLKDGRKVSLSKRAAVNARAATAKDLVAGGMTQAQAGEVLGVSQQTVGRGLSRNDVITHKVDNTKRTQIQLTIRASTAPETAARKILEKFGREFCDELVAALELLAVSSGLKVVTKKKINFSEILRIIKGVASSTIHTDAATIPLVPPRHPRCLPLQETGGYYRGTTTV